MPIVATTYYKPGKAIKHLEQGITIIKRYDLGINLLGRLYNGALTVAVTRSSLDAAKHYAGCAFRYTALYAGLDSEYAQKYLTYRKNPSAHEHWGKFSPAKVAILSE